MFHHVVLLKMSETATDDARSSVIATIETLRPRVKGLVAMWVKPDAGREAGNFDIVAQLVFESSSDFDAYHSGSLHEEVSNAISRDVAVRSSLQFEAGSVGPDQVVAHTGVE